jgi:hypothetical protein
VSTSGKVIFTPPFAPSLRSGSYFKSAVSTSTAVATANLEKASPIFIARPTRIDRIGVNVSATAVGSTIRVGIRNDSDGFPGSVLLEAGSIDSATATGEIFITINQILQPGWYWLTAVAQGGTPSTTIITVSNPYIGGRVFNTGFSGNLNAYTQTGVSGAFPATFTPSGIDNGICVMIRIA